MDYIENRCLICWELPTTQYIECLRCNINLHEACEQQYKSNNSQCKCPHCQKINTLVIKPLKPPPIHLPTIDTLLTEYTKLDHVIDNENICDMFLLGTVLYYIEKNFKPMKKNWHVVDCVITYIDTVNKQIGHYHPDENGRKYIGLIHYGAGHPFNVVDYYYRGIPF